jgi:hypothetical protein
MKPPSLVVVLFFIASIAAAQTLVTSPATSGSLSPSPSASASPPPQLYIPDGQIKTDPVKVWVAFANLEENMKPRLRDGRSDFKEQKEGWPPFLVAPNQTWTEKVAGQSVERRGTLLMFDLNKFYINRFKSTTRVTPVLSWPDAPGHESMIVGQSVYLGRRLVALGYTILVVVLLLIFITLLARKAISTRRDAKNLKGFGVLYLLSGHDNYMSLWRTQLAAWTIAVGGMVFMFGLIQFDVPRIPESLVALMGLSVATGGLSAIADKSKKPVRSDGAATTPAVSPPLDATTSLADPPSAVVPTLSEQNVPEQTSAPASKGEGSAFRPADRPRLAHLISTWSFDINDIVLSVPKAQMVFWTGIILVLFVVKSVLRGELWEVPWEVVTLTGVSQAGYLGDKTLERPKKDNQTPSQGL